MASYIVMLNNTSRLIPCVFIWHNIFIYFATLLQCIHENYLTSYAHIATYHLCFAQRNLCNQCYVNNRLDWADLQVGWRLVFEMDDKFRQDVAHYWILLAHAVSDGKFRDIVSITEPSLVVVLFFNHSSAFSFTSFFFKYQFFLEYQ